MSSSAQLAVLAICVFNVWNHGLLRISSNFITSKPPGRRMVTSDLNLLLNFTLHIALLTFSLGIVIRILFGTLSFWTVFLIVEVFMKISFLLVGAVANVSRVIHFIIIYHHQWLLKYNDKVAQPVQYSEY